MAGQLHGTVNGQPIQLNARGDTLALDLPSLAVAWRLRRSWPALRFACESLAPYYGVQLRCKAPGLPSFQIAPTRPWWLKPFLPR